MISLNQVGVEFQGIDLFSDISFIINPKDRIGLVGRNGAGKTTLLKILSGKMKPTRGVVASSTNNGVGHLLQELKEKSDLNIIEETMTAFSASRKIEQELAIVEHQVSTRTDYESDEYNDLLIRLGDLHHELALQSDGSEEAKVEQVLKGLGFNPEEFDKPMSALSGGWQMRVELAKLLVRPYDLLLLDEPTNHLDIVSIIWLEGFLKTYPGAIIIISHDKRFLDNTTNRTVEIVSGRIYDYNAYYSKYLLLREERMATQIAAYENQQKFIAQQEAFINRFKAKASKAKQAQSKLKQLDKLERIEIDIVDGTSMRLRFPPAPRSGEVALKGENLSKAYGPKKVLSDVDFKVLRGEKIAFVGKNGMGKSTLVKMIMEEVNYEGQVEFGHNVEVGYFAQLQDNVLNPELTVYQTIEEIAYEDWANPTKIRGLLGRFLFDENEMDKKVKVLSGGEKSRLSMARLLLKPINLLILDEPTNHLDISSKTVLKEALQEYDGTMIIVSHDRDFLSELTTRTYEFLDGKIKEHLGPIEEFLLKYKTEDFRAFELTGAEKKEAKKEAAKTEATAQPKGNTTDVQKNIKKVEHQIAELEIAIQAIETKLAEAATKGNDKEIAAESQRYDDKKRQLDTAMAQWENLLLQVG